MGKGCVILEGAEKEGRLQIGSQDKQEEEGAIMYHEQRAQVASWGTPY